jgi:hypothetical protein
MEHYMEKDIYVYKKVEIYILLLIDSDRLHVLMCHMNVGVGNRD